MVRFLRESEANYGFLGTLTVGAEYSRDPADFRAAVDRWLVFALRELREQHLRAGGSAHEASIFWWVEFQERGAPHLHLFYTHFMPWEELAQAWGRICSRFNLCGVGESDYFWRTSTKFERIRAGFRGMVAYARKYAAKAEQKIEVEGTFDGGWRGRFWGVRGNRRRGSCHVIGHGRSPVAGHVKRLQEWLDSLADDGLLVRIPWEEGEGAIYVTPDGGQLSETAFHVELELRLMRAVLAVREEEVMNAAGVRQSPEQVASAHLDSG